MKRDAAFDAALVAEGWLKPKKLKSKKDKRIKMRLLPYADGFVCAKCEWPLRYERIEFGGQFFCRPECAKQKHGIEGRVFVETVQTPDLGSGEGK